MSNIQKFPTALMILVLSACNSVYIKPHTMEPGAIVYVNRGGYTMKRSIKEALENRGFDVAVGSMRASHDADDTTDIDLNKDILPTNTRYVVRVNERREILRPVWCLFNGFWWWNFNVSIADQKTGHEIMSWRGRGCARSSMNMLDDVLDKLEK